LLLLLLMICRLGVSLALIDSMLDSLVVEALLHLLLLSLPGLDGANETATALRNITIPCHVDERGACHPGDVLLFSS
jgi:hypothetical protein